MAKRVVNPAGLFPSLQHGFSQVVVASGATLVFVSGQTAWDANKRLVGGAQLAEQVRQALRNLEAAVQAAGGSLADVVALRIYFVEAAKADIGAISTALRECFPTDPPASTWLGVSSLARPEFLVEIEATAVVGVASPS